MEQWYCRAAYKFANEGAKVVIADVDEKGGTALSKISENHGGDILKPM